MNSINKYISDETISYLKIEPYKIPNRLEDIENEISKISKHWSIGTWLLGERFEKIRDKKLFLEKGYNSFEEYIEYETPFSRSTVYSFIDIKKFFNPLIVEKIGSKSTLLIPILRKIEIENKDKLEEFKKNIIPLISNVSFRKAREVISDNYIKKIDNTETSNIPTKHYTQTKTFKEGNYTVIRIKEYNCDIKISENEIIIDTLAAEIKTKIYKFLKKLLNIKQLMK